MTEYIYDREQIQPGVYSVTTSFERITRCWDCKYEFEGICKLPDGDGDFRCECVRPEDFCSKGMPDDGGE